MMVPRRLRPAFVLLALLAAAPVCGGEFPETLQFLLAPPGTSPREKFESEHGPLAKREYWLSLPHADQVEAYLVNAAGRSSRVPVFGEDAGTFVTFDSPWKSEEMHGPNSVYLFDHSLAGDTLHIRTAKWILIHHNCAWGHPYKYDNKRLTPQALEQIPLEIVPGQLWDGNLHVNTETGMTLTLRVFSYGRPAENARVAIITDQGWQKELRTDPDGKAVFQLIRDYYPEGWEKFQRTRQGSLLFTARLEKEGGGFFKGHPYKRQILSTSLPWKYRPAKADYTSLASGLTIGFITIVFGAAAVFIYRERRRKPARRYRFDE